MLLAAEISQTTIVRVRRWATKLEVRIYRINRYYHASALARCLSATGYSHAAAIGHTYLDRGSNTPQTSSLPLSLCIRSSPNIGPSDSYVAATDSLSSRRTCLRVAAGISSRSPVSLIFEQETVTTELLSHAARSVPPTQTGVETNAAWVVFSYNQVPRPHMHGSCDCEDALLDRPVLRGFQLYEVENHSQNHNLESSLLFPFKNIIFTTKGTFQAFPTNSNRYLMLPRSRREDLQTLCSVHRELPPISEMVLRPRKSQK